MLLQVALECLQAVDRRRIVRHGEVREDHERAGSNLVARRYQRPLLVPKALRSSALSRPDRSTRGRAVGSGRAGKTAGDRFRLSRSRLSSPRVRKAAVRGAGCGRSLGPHRSFDRPPEALPIVERRQAPGEIKSEELERVGSGTVRNRAQTQAQPRQVLSPAIPGKRMPQANADQIDQAELVVLLPPRRLDQDVRGLQVAMRERPFVERSDQAGERDGQAADSLRGGRPAEEPVKNLADVARQVDGVCFLDRDQVGLVRQEPEERVAANDRSARQECEVLRRRDAAADEILAGLPRPPGARGAEQGEERVEPLLAIEPLVDRPRSAGHAPASSSRRPSSSASPSRRSSPAARNGPVGIVEQRLHSVGVEVARCDAPGRFAGIDLEILVRRPAAPPPTPPEPLCPEAGRVLDPPREPARHPGAVPIRFLQVGLQEAIAIGPTAAQPEEMVEQRQVLPGQLPGDVLGVVRSASRSIMTSSGVFSVAKRTRMLPGWKSWWSRPASCSRAVMTASASASFWRICDRSGSGQTRQLAARRTRRAGSRREMRQRDQVILEQEFSFRFRCSPSATGVIVGTPIEARCSERSPSFRPFPRRTHWRSMARRSGTRKCLI